MRPQRRNRIIRYVGIVFALLLFVAENAHAGGYAIPQQTATALALSNAVTAGVNDPSAVYYNPAALTEVEGNQILGGVSYINVQSSVENSGIRSINRKNDNTIPSLFANYHVPETDITLGFGTYAPFGLATKYDRDAFTRYSIVEARLKPFYLNFAGAWSPADWVSIGGGISYVYAKSSLSRAIYLGFAGASDARAKITANDKAVAFNLGTLLKHPTYPVKLGITYRSRVYLDFKGGDVSFVDSVTTGGAPFNTKVARGSLVLPAVASVGINWQINRKWSAEFVYDWTKWDDVATLKSIFESPLPALGGAAPISGLTVSANWKNTSTLRLGTLFHLNETWDLMGGIALDESPTPSETLGPIIPGADIFAINGGTSYKWKKIKLTAAYMAVFYKTRKVQNNILEAEAPAGLAEPFTPGPDKYETFNNFVSVSVNYQF